MRHLRCAVLLNRALFVRRGGQYRKNSAAAGRGCLFPYLCNLLAAGIVFLLKDLQKTTGSRDMKLTAEEAYRKYADRVFAAAFSVCGNRADADDAVQETFIRYCSGSEDFRDEGHIRAWLMRAAINRAKDLRRSFWRRNRVSWEDYMAEIPFEEPEDGRLFEAVMRLPEKYRTVIHLFYYEEYDIREIAEILHRKQGTVKSQLSRGRQLLKQMLKEEWTDDE